MSDIIPGQGPVWLVSNAASGSHKAEAVDAVLSVFEAAGRPVTRHFRLGEDDLPSGEEATAAGVSLVILHGGDGTITSATDALSGWEGEILVLPGGTMNLLARALHGELSVEEIAERAARGDMPAIRVPVITGEGYCALAGVIAGPTSAWGDVREHVRRVDLKALATSITEAINETLSGDDIALDGHDGRYQAILLEPSDQGISAKGVLARNAWELVQHGWAWLSGDFREGPSEDLGHAREVTLRAAQPVGLLIDGERANGGATLHFRATRSAHLYLSALGRASWS